MALVECPDMEGRRGSGGLSVISAFPPSWNLLANVFC